MPTDAPRHPIMLSRTVRAGLPFDGRTRAGGHGFAGVPTAVGLMAHHELTLGVSGLPDPATGYLIGIQDLDALARTHLFPLLQAAIAAGAPIPPAEALLRQMGEAAARHLPPSVHLDVLRWEPSPYVQHEWSPGMPDTALLTEHFEFSASHRLHVPALGDEENRRIFGKCNHPGGHGHNYRVAVTVAVPVGGAPAAPVDALARIVGHWVIDRFDHKHLNADCAEFRELNPSVEHIAMTCHGLLRAPLAAEGLELRSVTVWETAKTGATYPAPVR